MEKMRSKVVYLVCFAILLAMNIKPVEAQLLPAPNSFLNADTLCYSYKFNAGDTLYYETFGKDSIIIDYEPALTKMRLEQTKLWCDSVTNDGLMYLTFQLVNFIGQEKVLNKDSIIDRKTNWLGRKVSIAINSQGFRSDYKFDNISKPAIAPVGGIVPTWLIPIGKPCTQKNNTWLIDTVYGIPETSIPMTLVRNTALLRAVGKVDTLGYQCNILRATVTGSGIYEFSDANLFVKNTGVINAAHTMYFDNNTGFPIVINTQSIIKLQIFSKDGESIPGWHHLKNYTKLVKYHKATVKETPNMMNNKNKKLKKKNK